DPDKSRMLMANVRDTRASASRHHERSAGVAAAVARDGSTTALEEVRESETLTRASFLDDVGRPRHRGGPGQGGGRRAFLLMLGERAIHRLARALRNAKPVVELDRRQNRQPVA